jgi:chemotaxis signal transduction protein
MTNTPDSQTLHYLPVEVSGQMFAIPMRDVSAVHRVSAGTGPEGVIPQANGSSALALPVIDLSHLFWDRESPQPGTHIVLITTEVGMCAVLVNSLRPARTALTTDQSALPHLPAFQHSPFQGLVHEPDALVLIVDCRALVEKLQRASPELVLEPDHAT